MDLHHETTEMPPLIKWGYFCCGNILSNLLFFSIYHNYSWYTSNPILDIRMKIRKRGNGMRKNFVIDTNILIHNPNCLEKFEENNIYIPYPVIEELDGLKNAPGEAGFCAREATRNLAGLRNMGDLKKGIHTPGGGMIYLYIAEELDISKLPKGWKQDKMDNLILLSTLKLTEKKKNVILVTNDTNMILKADILGIKVQEYKNDRIAEGVELYSGRTVRHLKNADFGMFMDEKKILPDKLEDDGIGSVIPNEFINIMTWEGSSCLAKYDGVHIRGLEFQKRRPMGLKTRNAGQIFLQEALFSSYKEHPLTICVGPAGTGKTLFAIGCGLEQAMESNIYKRVLVCRANVMMDEEIGFLPGTEQDKISPLLRGVYDNLEVLFADKNDTKDMINDKITELFQRGYIEAQSVAYLRGRSITNTFIIIDEAQNCTPNQILSIITRAGEGSKIVLIGDANQIDNPRLDKRNNGLVYALERMKGSKLTEIVTFTESECTRSALAKEASDKLKK